MKIDKPGFDYEQRGVQYSGHRNTDPRIAAYIEKALGSSLTVLNVGAGSGSYESSDREVISVEPSAAMRMQRKRLGRKPAIIATADSLPFDDKAFDASMALLTIHHWPDLEKGLNEMRRVTKNQIVVMTYDPDSLDKFWNVNYFPELIEVEKARYPKLTTLTIMFDGKSEVISIPIPLDCLDGFQEAYYGRPEEFLKAEVRRAQSAWGFLTKDLEEEYVNALAADLESGQWDKKYGHLRTTPEFLGALKLIVSLPK